MGLLVLAHLDAMFDVAERLVGGRQRGRGRRGDDAGIRQRRKRAERGVVAQGNVSPAKNELLRLNEELDLSDAAWREFHIRRARIEIVGADLRIDHPLDGLDIADGPIVEISAPDVGLHPCKELCGRGAITGSWPALDPDHAFPVLADALVVEFRHLSGDGDRRRAWVRAEAQIGAEDVSAPRDLIHDLYDITDDALRGFAGVAVAAVKRVPLVEGGNVDIARIVELERAHLSQRDGKQAVTFESPAGEGHPEGRLQAIDGKPGEALRDVHDASPARQVIARESKVHR